MDTRTAVHGFALGVVATIAMSGVMIVGMVTGIAPMPRPIPQAVLGTVADGAPKPLAALAHLAYGGVFGALLAGLSSPVSFREGLATGVILWVVLGVAVLPAIGWGLFGTAITPTVAVATLVLHLIYGAVLGVSLDESAREALGTRLGVPT